MAQPDKSAARRAELTVRIAAILMQEGVATLPLRDLAARLGTSDRMLLYYFEGQMEIVGAALVWLSDTLAARLDRAIPAVRRQPNLLLKKLMAAMEDAEIQPILRVWGDVTARGGRYEQPFHDFAGVSVAIWRDWIAARLDVSVRARVGTAAAILAVVEGCRMLELSAPGAGKAAAAQLAKAFD